MIELDANYHHPTSIRRRRPLFWMMVAFGLGILIDALWRPALLLAGGWLMAAGAAAGMVLVQTRRGRPVSTQWARGAAGLVLALCAGLFMHAARQRIPRADDIGRLAPAKPALFWIRGRLDEASYRDFDMRRRWSWTVDLAGAGASATDLSPVCGRVQLQLSDDDAAASGCFEGDELVCQALLGAPPDVTVPGGFDTAEWLRSRGVSRQGPVIALSLERVGGVPWWRADLQLFRASRTLSTTLAASLPVAAQNDGSAGLLVALLFGRRDGLSVDDRDAFAATGTAHLLAVSGLQVQFMAWLLWKLTARLGLARRRGALVTMSCVLAYCLLTGCEAPIVRATLMIGAFLLAAQIYREPDPLNVLAVSALPILLVAPGELFSAGFQLSFAAVLALIALLPALEGAWRRAFPEAVLESPEAPGWVDGLIGGIRTALFTTLVAGLATMPIIAWHMGRVTLVGLLINIAAVPLSNLCIVAGVLALLFYPLGLASWAGWMAWVLVRGLQEMNLVAASLPLASVGVPAPPIPLLLGHTALLLWVWYGHTEKRIDSGRPPPAVEIPRIWAPFMRVGFAFGGCIAGLLMLPLLVEPAPGPAVTILDLESGRSAMVDIPGHGVALVDAGGPTQGRRLAEMLRRTGVRSLALLVLTADDPAALGGAIDLVKRMPVERVILPPGPSPSQARRELEAALSALQIPHGTPPPGQALAGPGPIRWEFFSDGEPDSKAASALAVKACLPGAKMLFVPLRSSAAVDRLLAQRDALQADAVRLLPGNRWPPQTVALLKATGCRSAIGGGSEPGELEGADIVASAQVAGVRLLHTRGVGSLRVQAGRTAAGIGSLDIAAFRNGQWTAASE